MSLIWNKKKRFHTPNTHSHLLTIERSDWIIIFTFNIIADIHFQPSSTLIIFININFIDIKQKQLRKSRIENEWPFENLKTKFIIYNSMIILININEPRDNAEKGTNLLL
ncbi:endothelin-converting enzyme 1 [Sarcoptes scabiei]|nr:endothelin-converting enzyme 1 [Sarcoptes scabiei]